MFVIYDLCVADLHGMFRLSCISLVLFVLVLVVFFGVYIGFCSVYCEWFRVIDLMYVFLHFLCLLE